ncbi:hypothetical protein AAD001_09835 [Colwelliaceae bacterium 6471]
MNHDEIERLDSLSEKAINNIATPNEIREFSKLLEQWNENSQNDLTMRYFQQDNFNQKI